MVDIRCLVCGQSLKIPSNINPDNYKGHIFCHRCNLLLSVKLKSSLIEEFKVVKGQKIVVEPKIVFKSAIPEPDYSKEAEEKQRD